MKNRSASWHFYKLYIGSHHDGMDFLVTEGLAPALALIPDVPWFYLRYVDEKGLHLRVRFQLPDSVEPGTEAAIYASLHDALTRMPLRPATLWSPLVSFRDMPQMPAYQLPVHCERAEYQPETEVYGGESGISIAESLFHYSSQIARAILLAEQSSGITRKDLGLPLILAVLQQFIPVQRHSAFLESYATFWLAGSPEIGMLKNSFADRAWELIDDGLSVVTPQLAGNAHFSQVLSAWEDALAQIRRQYQRHCDRFNDSLAENLAFQFVHLMNNRLGFNTLDESWLAVLLSKSLESGAIHAPS